MKKLLLLVLVSLNFNLVSVYGQSTQTAYLVRLWNHNKELQNNIEKQDSVIQELKNKILANPLFIYSTTLDKNQLILISQDDNIDGSVIQQVFEPYLIKTNVIGRKQIANSNINLIEIPVYNSQNLDNYKNRLLIWEAKNTESVHTIKTLFTFK